MSDELEHEVRRLRRRLERERESRRQAEVIADRGMRELWLANRELDARVSERTRDLEETLANYERVVSVRERFLATLSHEMRTPMNGLLGMLELLEGCLADPNDLTYLATASESAARLNLLLTRLLDLLDLQTGAAGRGGAPLEVRAFAEAIERRWQRPALRTGHLLTMQRPSDPLEVFADGARIDQIVDELIDNALTHAEPGLLRVTVEVESTVLELCVIDSGPGIDPSLLARVADDFEMLDASSTRRAQGLGLGLSLCRQTAELLEGSLEIESDGSTHTLARLRLPVGPPSEPALESGRRRPQLDDEALR